ncbi:MAG: helix-turn-helix domain-containing protein [Candidatus Planktophila sp.]|nr:helix-turn-helix domain-containing protein [Candidatus Planktophila sp.]
MDITKELQRVQQGLRAIRESQGLTLSQASAKSNGGVSAIALGSYERGDRTISARKLMQIAQIYGVPVTAFFGLHDQANKNTKMIIDCRKLNRDEAPLAIKLNAIVKSIASIRSDWNGEVISLRENDLASLRIFGSITAIEIDEILDRYVLAK